MAPDNYNWLI